MTVVISLRMEEKEVEEIESLGYKPSDFLRKSYEKELKRERGLRAIAYFRRNRFNDPSLKAEDMIREDRDSR